MKYTRSATDVVGYDFKGSRYCPDCIADAMYEAGVISVIGVMIPLEVMLEKAAPELGIDRNDERSYDTDEFPKVVFDSSLTCLKCDSDEPHDECVPETCENCEEEL